MWEIYVGLVILELIFTILPKIPSSYWVFRVADFGKIQLNYITAFTFLYGFFLFDINVFWWYFQALLLLMIIFHSATLVIYTPIYPVKKIEFKDKDASKNIRIISANIYQFNDEYSRFIEIINKYQPDIFLTMESNSDWEKALNVLEKDFPYQHKVMLENTYGMHLYSKIKIEDSKTHYFVAEDVPSIEAHLSTEDGFKFIFFGIHPPPPSPTEEKTSKERDGDLLSAAKLLKNAGKDVLVIGDFNNVAWSKSSILFRKTSELIDPRVGNALISTFHAKYRLLRFPIDLMFHSKNIFIKKLKTLEKFGSDHLPVYCEFSINHHNEDQKEKIEKADSDEKQDADEMISEGQKETSDRDSVAKE